MSADPISELETRCKERPDDPAALIELARAYEQAGRPGKAFLTYRGAIEKNWSEKSSVEFHLRYFAAAQASVDRLFREIELHATSDGGPESRAQWVCALADTGRLKSALTELPRAVKDIGVNDPPPDFLLAAYRAVAIALLRTALEDRHEWVRRPAAQALADLGEKAGIPILVMALRET